MITSTYLFLTACTGEQVALVSAHNPLGLVGLDFIEFSGPDAHFFEAEFKRLGFVEVGQVHGKNIRLFRQGDINFVVNCEPQTFATEFSRRHGPSICATGFRVEDAQQAVSEAVKRGARLYENGDQQIASTLFPAIYGIGESLVFFMDPKNQEKLYKEIFLVREEDAAPIGNGLQSVDHLTNNIPEGELQKWYDFYAKIFGFRDQANTMTSTVMQSPSGNFSIVVNEPSAANAEILEYLKEVKGSGVQHVALSAAEPGATSNVGSIYFEIVKKGTKRWSK